METINQQQRDDAPIADYRRWIYRKYGEARQPMLDDMAKTGQGWSAWDYLASPIQSGKMGLTALGAMVGDQSLQSGAYDTRMKVENAAEEAAKNHKLGPGSKAFSPWVLMRDQGVLSAP